MVAISLTFVMYRMPICIKSCKHNAIHCKIYTCTIAELFLRENILAITLRIASDQPILALCSRTNTALLLEWYPSATRTTDVDPIFVFIAFGSWRALTLWDLIFHRYDTLLILLRFSITICV